MTDNKNTLFGILILIFVVILTVVAILNNKIAEELDNHSAESRSAVSIQSHAMEEVKASQLDVQPRPLNENVVNPLGSAIGDAQRQNKFRSAQDQTETVYELPLREVELPQ